MFPLLQNQFVGSYELRKKLSHLLAGLKKDGEIVVTQRGKPKAILMAVEEYLELQEAMREFSDPLYLSELLAAKKEIETGKGTSAKEFFKKLGV
ncbi:type II toxin-antitoxin system Phd/YefM family antitoxin [Candidatus Microgenomates bacterium]|nr:type II toxin-antitoxin system Phd/YefM family antitoxin [Candidatus Microgenomates bacterium]